MKLVWKMQQMAYDDVVYMTYYQKQAQAFRTDRFKGWITDAPTLELKDASSMTAIEPVK